MQYPSSLVDGLSCGEDVQNRHGLDRRNAMTGPSHGNLLKSLWNNSSSKHRHCPGLKAYKQRSESRLVGRMGKGKKGQVKQVEEAHQ